MYTIKKIISFIVKNKDKFGNVIDRTSRVAIYLTDDVNSLYFDFI